MKESMLLTPKLSQELLNTNFHKYKPLFESKNNNNLFLQFRNEEFLS